MKESWRWHALQPVKVLAADGQEMPDADGVIEIDEAVDSGEAG